MQLRHAGCLAPQHPVQSASRPVLPHDPVLPPPSNKQAVEEGRRAEVQHLGLAADAVRLALEQHRARDGASVSRLAAARSTLLHMMQASAGCWGTGWPCSMPNANVVHSLCILGAGASWGGRSRVSHGRKQRSARLAGQGVCLVENYETQALDAAACRAGRMRSGCRRSRRACSASWRRQPAPRLRRQQAPLVATTARTPQQLIGARRSTSLRDLPRRVLQRRHQPPNLRRGSSGSSSSSRDCRGQHRPLAAFGAAQPAHAASGSTATAAAAAAACRQSRRQGPAVATELPDSWASRPLLPLQPPAPASSMRSSTAGPCPRCSWQAWRQRVLRKGPLAGAACAAPGPAASPGPLCCLLPRCRRPPRGQPLLQAVPARAAARSAQRCWSGCTASRASWQQRLQTRRSRWSPRREAPLVGAGSSPGPARCLGRDPPTPLTQALMTQLALLLLALLLPALLI